jgi:hypothetical protein
MRLKELKEVIDQLVDEFGKVRPDLLYDDVDVYVVEKNTDPWEKRRTVTHAGIMKCQDGKHCVNLYAATEGWVYTPESSNIDRIRYDIPKQELTVVFKNGGAYRYNKVPGSIYESFVVSDSKGKYLNSEIKGKFEFMKLNE